MIFKKENGVFLLFCIKNLSSLVCINLLFFSCFPLTSFSMSVNDSPISLISCHIEGGNIAIKATTIEYFFDGEKSYLQETKHFWEKDKKNLVKTITIPLIEYKKLWDWIEAENVWDLKDVSFPAEDAVTYTFHFKKNAKEKTINAMSVSTLQNKKYYLLYTTLKKLKNRYISKE